MSYLVKDKTREERKEIIDGALALTSLGGNVPSKEVIEMSNDYIEGKIELIEIEKAIDRII